MSISVVYNSLRWQQSGHDPTGWKLMQYDPQNNELSKSI